MAGFHTPLEKYPVTYKPIFFKYNLSLIKDLKIMLTMKKT